jgi:hypothetical protein
MAPHNPFKGYKNSLKKPILFYSLISISGTTWIETAPVRQKLGNKFITFDKK